MPTQANPYFVITDGSVTATFHDGSGGATNYIIAANGWAPAIGRLNPDSFDGNGPYDEMEETITFHIRDTTAAGCFSKLHTLNDLLLQAERFAIAGEDATMVEAKYAPKGSTVSSTSAPLRGMVLSGSVTPPPTFGDTGITGSASGIFYIRNLVMRFRHRVWRVSSVVDSSSAATNGDEASVAATGGALSNYSPVKISFSNGLFYTGCADRFLLLHDDADGITIIPAEGLADAGVYTSVTDAGDFPRNTNILRYTPGVTTPVDSGGVAFTTSGKKLLVFANIRNNSTSADYYVKAKIKSTRNIETAEQLIPANATPFAAWYCLGMISAPAVPSAISLTITASATGAGTLDIDTLVTLDIEDPAHACIQLGFDDNVSSGVTESTFTVGCDPGYIDARRPSVSGSGYMFRKTDIAFWSKAATMYACWLATGDGSDVEDWRTNSGGSAISNTFTLTRYPVYLTPQ